jgi:hypothetical protein
VVNWRPADRDPRGYDGDAFFSGNCSKPGLEPGQVDETCRYDTAAGNRRHVLGLAVDAL